MSNPKKQKFYNPFELRDENGNFGPKEPSFNSTEVESNLIMPSNSDSCMKNTYEYEELDQTNYNTPLKATKLNIREQFSNYHGHHIGPGKGFGNLNISNDIRQGSSTRLENEDAKLKLEKEVNSRYDIIDRNYQNPNNLIMPFSRGGENTRKTAKNHNNNSEPTVSGEKFEPIDSSQEYSNQSNALFELNPKKSDNNSKYAFKY